MALYRETATGFVQEYASNPGAGYTLVSSQPTDTLTNRVNWWRDVDKGTFSSDWHPSIQSGADEIPGNDTRSGSGINIMPNDYSSFEWSGSISPVFTQTASYSRTAAATYAGQYGVRLTLTGSGGYIGLSSSSATYNIVLSPSSKWIGSVYVRPTTSVAQTVTVTLVTASGSYSFTGVTEASSSTWKRISGVFDLSADVSIAGQIRVSTSTTAASLDFDAVMLEEKVGPFSEASAYYNPWGNGTVEGEFPDGGIPQSKLYSDLSTRINLIDNSLPGSVNARLAAQYDTLVQQISTVAVGNGEFDANVIWYFDAASEITGWTSNNATLAVSGGYLTVTATGATPWFRTATIAVDGAAFQLVRMRVKRTGGTGWNGTLTYFYSGGSSTKVITEPTSIGSAYVEASWDMSAETLWTSNTITGIRIQLGSASGDNYSNDWMGVGRNAPGASYTQVNAVRVLADNKNRVFYQTAAPASDSNYTLKTNDLWFDTDDGYKPYRYNGSTWIETTDTRLASSWAEIYDIGNATASPSGAAAQRVNGISATAASKIKTYYQASTSTPSSPTVGDIWFKTDLNNRAFRWSGSAWVETSDVRIVNLQASVVNKEEAKIGYCSINPSSLITKATCEAGGGTWIDQPLATAVKQVSVTTGYGTATIENTFSAISTDTGALKLTYSVKLDNNGYVTGFGLYNDGVGSSGFIVRADKFIVGSASNNTVPFQVDTGTGVTYINIAAIKDASIISAKIGTIEATKITAGTIGSQTINLNGATSILQSTGFVSGTTGWRIKGDGTAEFQNVTVRGSLNAADLNDGGITALKIGSLQVTEAKIANLAVTEAKIASLAVTEAKIANLSVTDAKINDLSANKLTAGTINANIITVSNLNASNISTGTLAIDRLSFTPVGTGNVVSTINASSEGLRIASGKIYIDGSVQFSAGYNPTGKIASGGAATDINNNTTEINGGKISTGSLTADKIDTGTLTAKTLTLNGGAIRSYSYSAGSSGWQIDGYGNAEFNTVMVRTKNIENNSVTKMTGGSLATRSTQYLSNWDDQITINCDGGDILASVSVTLNGTTEFTYGNFTLYINGSQVDYKTCTAVTNGSSSVTVSGYYVNAPSGNVIVRLYSFVDNNSNNGGTWSGSYYAINGKK